MYYETINCLRSSSVNPEGQTVTVCRKYHNEIGVKVERIFGMFLTRVNSVSLMAFVLLFCGFNTQFSAADDRVEYNFNPGWKVFVGDPDSAEKMDFDDSQWAEFTLPYAWNQNEAFKVDIHDLSTGIAWYRKHFTIPAEYADKKIFIEFEGIRQAGEFYLNGEFIGRHENGAMAFGFDMTGLIKIAPDENVIAVRTDNSWDYHEKATNSRFQWNDKNFNANYGGITKNVKLHIKDKLYQTLPLYSTLGTTGVYVYAEDFDIDKKTAAVTAESQVKNEYPVAKTFEYEVTVKQLDGDVVKTFSSVPCTVAPGGTVTVTAGDKLEGLNFWSWGYGYLYDVRTTLKVDSKAVDTVVTRTGFRKTEFANGMIKLNDRVIQVKGYAQRTSNEWPAVGVSVPPWISDFSNRLMIEDNANLVRWMHITPSKQDVESCDRVGLMQAMPAGDSEKDVSDRRWGQRLELMRDAIIYNRNNPSIVFYEGGNENISEEHMKELKNIRDKYDPNGGRAIGSREMLDSRVAEYGGEMLYINKSARIPMWAMEYCRDEGLRKYWDEYSPPYHKDGDGPFRGKNHPAAYNRNQDSLAIEDIIRWYDYYEQRPGTGHRVSSGGVNIIFSDTNTHYRGAENYRRSGVVDPIRIPKDAFYAHQVMWDGWVDVERPGIHLMGHWNYEPSTVKDIYAVSSADKVELFINDKSMGFGEQSYRFLYTFENIHWQKGSIRAVGYDANGSKLCEAVLQTAGEPKSIRLNVITSPTGLKADGSDMALIDVEVIDSQENRCPTAMNKIDFELTGPAVWIGGIAQGPDNYIMSKSVPVECGVNRVMIKTITNPGKITLKAAAVGLEPAVVELNSKASAVSDGLSSEMPDEGLLPYLGRGPTPKGPSYKVTRIPLEIRSVLAGSNQTDAANTFDDNEMTGWKNDGMLSTAWLRYDLKETAVISELVIKFGNWRRRTYPVTILVDDKKVFEGETKQNLGYYTIKFPPAAGKTVTLQMTGAGLDRDGFGLVEVTGKVDQAEKPAGPDAKGRLDIIELEIYGPVNTSMGGGITTDPAVSVDRKIALWDSNAPFALGEDEKDVPVLFPYILPAEKSAGTAIVICPGGGYGHLAMDHEGRKIAEWFNSVGVNAFVLRYRLPSDGYCHPVPLIDVQRAIRTVRYNADKWNIRQDKIGVIGFSAGGHLASSAVTHFSQPPIPDAYQQDEIDKISPRPDFAVLIYPVISMQTGITHEGSRNNLLGSDPSPELVDLMSGEKQVTADTPETFLVHAGDDTVVVPENSIRFYQALIEAKVSAEMHMYPAGGHGFGTRPNGGRAAQWPRLCRDWMVEMKVLDAD